MNGNATYRHRNTAVLSVTGVEAPVVVTSAEFDERLAPTLARLRLRPGMLQNVAGITERRWWPQDVGFADAAAMAGAKALSEAGVDAAQVGLLINTSVARDHLEPSMAVQIHDALGLPTSAQSFDLLNACLGFVNAMHVAASMIDAGQIRYALVVDGEGARQTHEATLDRLASPETTLADFLAEFATLTLGSGSAAAVLGPADAHPGSHRFLGGVARAGTEHHDLCVGDLVRMRTDTRGLMDAGLALAVAAWEEAQEEWQWASADRFVMHQISTVHTNAIVAKLGLDPAKVPLSFPRLGNIGPASLPLTLAQQVDSLNPGDRVICMGIGSGQIGRAHV